MNAESRLARVAGLLYLVVVLTGLFSLAYVPSKLVVHGDPQATLERMVVSETLLRYGVASFLVEQVAFLFLAFALYRLLRAVDQIAAAIMVMLVVASVPLALMSVVERLNLLSLLDRSDVTHASDQLLALARSSFDAYSHGLLVTSVFWGLWLFPFGFLIMRSRLLPRVLGVFLMIGCAGYVVDVLCSIVLPGYGDMAMSNYMTLPAAIGEIGSCLWLLVVGVRRTSTLPLPPSHPL
ncbi:DUF4386 domain-containing protein [Dyella jiangningensis]|uniref:DUF4386 domain-containing protein n=1 Tax=Dyella jiangningensis TaxID=1379159 RepID=A0A328P468_9GAMM|nr:DUF4386 domain-containing protein [Dyella jiangningensis]RAO76819.1 hypothetical protein CA260_02570 [Dyella jiangningensis]